MTAETSAVRALIAQWREYSKTHEVAARNHEALKSDERWPQEHRRIARAYDECADDLESALAMKAESAQPWQSLTRLEVVSDVGGRMFAQWNVEVEPSFQDDGRTLKLFIKARREAQKC